jgi:serine/threonine-protein kinase RsbW
MSPLRILAPPARLRLLLSWDLTSEKDLRRIRDELLALPLESAPHDGADPDEMAQRIGLVATELAGNALRHGLPPVVARLLRDDTRYFLDVSDGAPDKPPEPAETRSAVSVGGRGLRIAQALAHQVGWHATADSKHVWASFAYRDGR